MTVKEVCILTVSDRCSRGEAEDTSGQALAEFFSDKAAFKVTQRFCVPDEKKEIIDALDRWVKMKVNLILTTGGTGFSPRDVTPEATAAVIDRPAPGIVHQLHTKSLSVTPMAMLSRYNAGIKDRTLIINFPGSKKASLECIGFVFPVLQHGTDLIDDVKILDCQIRGNTQSARFASSARAQAHVCPHQSGSQKSQVDIGNVAGRVRQSPFPMISVDQETEKIKLVARPGVDQAQASVLGQCHTLGTTQVVFHEALNRVLAEDVFAKDPLPPFPASIKDGYAVRSSDGGSGVRKVVGGSTAGLDPQAFRSLASGECVRINTGAPLPEGSDAVVQVEDTKLIKSTPDGREELEIEILSNSIRPGLDVRPVGSDIAQGSRVLPKFSKLGPAELGILATVGAARVSVFKLPVVGILSTGNELQDPAKNPGEELEKGRIRDSNKTVLKSLIQDENRFPVIDCGIAEDEPQVLLDAVRKSLEKCDVLVTTGGVSMGDRDLLRQILKDDLGAELHFGRVAMKPGKPTTFATVLDPKGMKKLVIGLPGNPVSAAVTAQLYVLPACRKLSGQSKVLAATIRARVPSDIQLDPRPEYQRVVIDLKPGQAVAEVSVTGNQISSRLPSLAAANGLLLLPARTEQKPFIAANEEVDCMVIGPLLR